MGSELLEFGTRRVLGDGRCLVLRDDEYPDAHLVAWRSAHGFCLDVWDTKDGRYVRHNLTAEQCVALRERLDVI